MRIHFECHEPRFPQVVHDSLHILAISAHVAGEPRHRLWVFGVGDGSEHLPAGARQPEPRHDPVAYRQEEAVQPEYVEDEVGQGLSSPPGFGRHLSPYSSPRSSKPKPTSVGSMCSSTTPASTFS